MRACSPPTPSGRRKAGSTSWSRRPRSPSPSRPSIRSTVATSTTVLPERAKQNRAKGLYVLIAKKETKIEVESSREYAKALTKARNQEVRSAFIEEFKKRDFNAGLNSGDRGDRKGARRGQGRVRRRHPSRGSPPPRVAARHRGPARASPRHLRGGGGGFGLSSLLGIGLLILAVLFGIRLLGSLFGGGNRGYAGQQRMGGRPRLWRTGLWRRRHGRWRRRWLHVEHVRWHRRCPCRELALRSVLREVARRRPCRSRLHGRRCRRRGHRRRRRRDGVGRRRRRSRLGWRRGRRRCWGGGDWGGGGGGGDWGGGGGGGDWGGGGDGGGGGDW